MKTSAPPDSADRARSVLQGYPGATVDAAVRFVCTREAGALDQLLRGVLAFHLPARPDGPVDPATIAGSTRLVEELAVDSLVLVELSFLLEDLLGERLTDEQLRSVATFDDLSRLLRQRLGVAAAAS